MNHNTYALLIGINQYSPNSTVPHLQGCTNDVKAMQAYLEGRVAKDASKLHLKVLLNEQATRQAVIDGLRNHLCQAGPDDVAFFFYAGHGAQENAPEEFWHLEPDRLDETLVCYDSRTDGSWDLADKELAKLIAEVAARNPHIVVILDCCHSGSGTRGTLEQTEAVRRAPMDKRQRPLSSFIVAPDELPAIPSTRSVGAPTSGWQIPQGRHVLLSACRDIEEAKEYSGDGEHRGAFSYFLLETLQKANGTLTYRDVFKRASALVQSRVTAQAPQLEASVSDDLDQPFLGGAIQPRTPHFTVSHHRDHGWVIDGGTIHGIAQPRGGETTLLALFPFDSGDEVLRAGSPVGTAVVTSVMPGMSQIEIDGIDPLDMDMTFKAVITALPLPPMGVVLSGEAGAIAQLQQSLDSANGMGQPSLYVRAVENATDAIFQVLAEDGEYRIKRPADDRILVAPLKSEGPGQARQLVSQLENLARWTTFLELESSPTSRIKASDVTMEISHSGTASNDGQIRLNYQVNGDGPEFQVKLKNHSNRALFCTILDLTESFGIGAPFFVTNTGGIWLDAGQEVMALDGEPLQTEVPDDFWQQGITEYKDVLKLIVSTAEFDATAIGQEGLDAPPKDATRSATRSLSDEPEGTLSQLFGRIQTRAIRPKSQSKNADDWMTSQVTLTTVRPKGTVPISDGSLMAGVQILPHTDLQAQARLTTVNQSTRDLGNHILPPLLRDHTQPFQFTPSRATDPGLSALELRDVQNREAVTPENPLKVVADVPLEADAYVLPVAYDGEFYLPLGRGIGKGNQTEITIDHLPEPISEGKRSLGGAIRIFFQKVVTKKLGPELSQQLGLTFEYPILAVAEVHNGEVTYIADVETVASRVAQAKRIALYIHGIIGDTQSMVPSIETAMAALEEEARPLKDCYDLVLAFDYESINTSIENHARSLKKRLQDVGLGPNHDKTLHIIAHSMGGLVSRWFVEQEDGNQVVQHLILLGTPSGGSPWPQTVAGLTTLLAMVLNGLSTVVFPLKILASAVERIETIDVTLDEMEPDSDFIQELSASNDPGVPYTVIAGNITLINPADSPQKALAEKLAARLKTLMKLPFFGVPSDLAVTVESIKAIPPGRNPEPRMVEVGCDHLVYFTDPVGVQSLGDAVQSILAGVVLPKPVEPEDKATPLVPAPDPAKEPQPEPVKEPSLRQEKDKSDKERKPFPIGWVVGAIALLVAVLLGVKLLNPPEPKPNPSSQSSSQVETS